MGLGLPVVLLSAVALVGSGAIASGQDKEKSEKKDSKEKITICHVPPGNAAAQHTITVGAPAWSAHQRHGDRQGACGDGGTSHDRRFDELDTDHDGVLSREEFRRS